MNFSAYLFANVSFPERLTKPFLILSFRSPSQSIGAMDTDFLTLFHMNSTGLRSGEYTGEGISF